MRAEWFNQVIATDASTEGLGVVAARHPASELLSGDLSAIACVDWRTIISYQWRDTEHINVLELRALSTAVRWALSSPTSIGRRLFLLSDSLVVIGAVNKGRSSSQQLLRRLRFLSALLLASGMRLFLRWLPSELNPADGPSREF
jgi:hypothetical protein